MTNSFFNFNEAADFASQLQDSYDQINRGYDRREQLEQENDRTREINAAMPMKIVDSLAEFSLTLKKASDKKKEERYQKLEDYKYGKDDPEEQAKYDANTKWLYDSFPGYRKATKIAIETKDTNAQEILKQAPFAQHDDKMTTIQGIMHGVPQYWHSGGFASAYKGETTAAGKQGVVKQFTDQLTLRNPLLKGTNKHLIKNTVERKVEDYISTVAPSAQKALTDDADKRYEGTKNNKLLQALDPDNKEYTFENFKQEYSYDYPNGMGGASHDTIDRLYKFAKHTDDVSTDQVRQAMKMDAGGMPYEERFPLIAGEKHTELNKLDKQQRAADKAKKDQAYDTQNEAALIDARQRLADGEDVEVIKRNLLEVQGNNKLAFAKENTDIETFIDGLDQSFDSYIADNAAFEAQYMKGQLTVEEVEGSSFELQKKWLSRAQAQAKAREDKNYKDSRSAVEQIVKGKSNLWKQSSRGSLMPHTNAVRGKLVEKFEEEFTRLTEAGDPNAAVNAAISVETYWTKNGGGEVEVSEEDGRLFVTSSEGIYENYMNSIAPSTTRKNAETELNMDLYSTAVKLEMTDNNIQQALDTPNVFLSETEVMQEITRLASREGYSPKLKAMASLYGKPEAVGGVRGILERQAAVYGIPKENIPEELQSITEIYSQGDPFINCLIREKGFEGLSTNQLLRQCAFISEQGTDDEELEIPKRAAFQ